MASEKYPYQEQWEEFKFRQTTFWLVFAGYMLFMFLVGFVAQLILPADLKAGDKPLFFAFVLYATITFGIFGVRYQFWKCPRCGNFFARTFWRHNIFTNKCLHCKLPKYEGSNFANNFDQSYRR